jgi:hypothetical protein
MKKKKKIGQANQLNYLQIMIFFQEIKKFGFI